MSLRRRRAYFYFFFALSLIATPLLALYTGGYRLGEGFRLVETGGIYIYSPELGSSIYMDQKKKAETNFFQRDLFVQNLRPDTYAILIAKDGFWPWSKEINVEEGRVAEAIAFLIPREPKGESIFPRIEDTGANGATTTRKNPRYTETLALFAEIAEKKTGENREEKKEEEATQDAAESPLPENAKISGRGRVALFENGNQIFARWLKDVDILPFYFCNGRECLPLVLAFSSLTPVKSFDFYPGREDVFLIAVQNGIYAIEIDARKNQNFQPVYKGGDPSFVIVEKTLYVKDSDNLFTVTL